MTIYYSSYFVTVRIFPEFCSKFMSLIKAIHIHVIALKEPKIYIQFISFIVLVIEITNKISSKSMYEWNMSVMFSIKNFKNWSPSKIFKWSFKIVKQSVKYLVTYRVYHVQAIYLSKVYTIYKVYIMYSTGK